MLVGEPSWSMTVGRVLFQVDREPVDRRRWWVRWSPLADSPTRTRPMVAVVAGRSFWRLTSETLCRVNRSVTEVSLSQSRPVSSHSYV